MASTTPHGQRPPGRETCAQAKYRNTQLACDHPGCPNRRKGLYRFCGKCAVNATRYGHPRGHRIRPVEWRPYLVKVQARFDRNPYHSGLLEALAFIAGWLRQAASAPGATPGGVDMQRLAMQAVDPQEILAVICAVFAYSVDRPQMLPDDARLDFAISRAVASLRPLAVRKDYRGRPRRVPIRRTSLASLGRHARHNLAPFLVNVAQTVSEEAERREARALTEAMRQPFGAPVAHLVATAEAQP